MSASVANESRRTGEGDRQFPAYGPIEAVLGYLLFYVLVDRLTPAVVAVFSDAVLDLSPSFVRFGLATALWFVLAVTAIDQVRRQLAAVGVVTSDDPRLRVWSRVTPSSVRTTRYVLALVAGTLVAAVTFEPAVSVLESLIPAVAAVDVVAFDLVEFSMLVVFFLAYSVAAHSLDRLVIDGVRALGAE